MADFTVTIKRSRDPGTKAPARYYAVMYDSRGRVRATGDKHWNRADAEQDAFVFFRNLPI